MGYNQEIHKTWTERHQVSWDETSPSGRLNLTGLNIFLQRVAVEHAEHLGFGYQEMSKLNLSWVLIRLNIEINRLPQWREKIKLTTWPRAMNKLSAHRDFTIYSEKDNSVLCNATSEWFLIDLTSRRPQRMEKLSQFDQYLTSNTAVSNTVEPIKKDQVFCDLFSTTARYSGLDMNGHINARKYFDWLEDAVFELVGSREISFIQMNYFHECKHGEEVVIQYSEEDNGVIRGWKPEKQQVAFLSKVVFK